MKSIRAKIITSYIMITIFSIIVAGGVFNTAFKSYLERISLKNLEQDLITLTNLYRADIVERLKNDPELLNTPLEILTHELRKINRFGMESAGGVVIKDLKGKLRAYAFKKDDNVMIQKYLNDMKFSNEIERFKISHQNSTYLMISRPIKSVSLKSNDSGNVARVWLVMYLSINEINSVQKSILVIFLFAFLISIVIIIPYGIYSANRISKPVVRLNRRASLFVERDFDTKIKITTGDEIEKLANTMNHIADELKSYDIAQKKFIQNASHELKTPLMSIQGYAEGIKDGVFEDENKALDIIISESQRLKKLVEDIIYLSKLETMEEIYRFEPCSINDALYEGISRVESLAYKNNIKILPLLAKDTVLRLDKDKFIQAIINILGNCLRYAHSEITVTSSKNEDCIKIVIIDDGEGFDEKELNNVFKRFYKGKQGNTGLGMSITKVIIEKLGGSITVANSDNGGATFTICMNYKN